jgi:MSHA pilin protein MshD
MRKRKNGFSLVEIIVLLVVVSIAAAPMTSLLYQTLSDRGQASMQIMATSLAQGVMEEVLSKAYEDPDGSPGSFGTEEGSRINYDDVDDYDALDDAPPRDSQSNALSSFSGFRTQVVVENVTAAAPDGTAQSDGSTDFKRVTVEVSWNSGSQLVRLKGLAGNFSTSDGGLATGLTFIERSSSSNSDLIFRVRNDTGEDLYLTHLIASYSSSPITHYEQIEINVEGYQNYGDVWDETQYNNIRMGSEETAMFNENLPVCVPDGRTMSIKLASFYNNKNVGTGVLKSIDSTAFTIEMWAAPHQFNSFTVPSF